MSRRPGELTPYLSNRHFYGSELRRLRVDAQMTLENVASRTISSKSQIHRIEQAEMLPPLGISEQLDRLFETDGHFDRLYHLVVNSQEIHPEQYRRYMAMEARATVIEEYVGSTISGLIQTEAYARELFRITFPMASEDEIQQKMDARFGRQQLLQSEKAPDYTVILDEAVLRRTVGSPSAMREQLDHLLALTNRRRTTVQLIPFADGFHALMGGSLTLLTLDDGTTAAYEESINSGTLFEESESVSDRQQKYNALRSHALSPSKTAAFIRDVREALPA